jgi:transposase InsO family protein
MTFQFIDDHRDEFPIRRMCQVLGVSRSGYYAWRQRWPSQREMANQELGDKIEEVYEKSHRTYGSPRIFRALQRQGVACSENRVARLMRQRDLQAQQTRAYKSTTRRNAADPVAPNLLLRDFTTARPNEVWLSDITYIRTQAGWLYLAATLDLYSRRIIGWAMADRQTKDLTLRALRMALGQRQVPAGLIHHSDQGSQYTSSDYQQLLQDWGLQVSMNGVGTWYDNAPMESFFGTLKSEWAHHHVYATRQAARTDLYYYIEAFYNRQRLHSALDYVSPVTYEAQYHQNLAIVPG